jgi:hypothetical protein
LPLFARRNCAALFESACILGMRVHCCQANRRV